MPALLKPSRLERKVSKWTKTLVRDKEKQARKRQADRKWRALSALVCQRDKGICGVCAVLTGRATGDPRLVGQAHHVTYRSAGGKDVMENLVWLCGQCHADEHAHLVHISGTAARLLVGFADPNDPRRFIQRVSA